MIILIKVLTSFNYNQSSYDTQILKAIWTIITPANDQSK